MKTFMIDVSENEVVDPIQIIEKEAAKLLALATGVSGFVDRLKYENAGQSELLYLLLEEIENLNEMV